MRKSALVQSVALVVLMLSGAARGAETEFLEKFAFGDREAALKKLVPGTEDYYYYHCLHLQLQGKLDQVEKTLKAWRTRMNGTSSRHQLIARRNRLLRYRKDPAGTLEFIRRDLSVQFNHSRRPVTRRGPGRAVGNSSLDQKLIAPELRIDRLLKRDTRGLGRFTDEGLYLLSGRKLSVGQTRNLLKRVKDPVYPGLVKLILADLAEKYSGRFGSLHAHSILTLDQMKQLARGRPKLLREQKFVAAWIARLAPPDGVDVGENTRARAAWLDRLEAFSEALPGIWNSFRAQVLYNRLVHERAAGNYDLKRFRKYLELPSSSRSGVNPTLVRAARSGTLVSFSSRTAGSLPAIGNDSKLVRDYLEHFLKTAKDASGFEKYFHNTFLRRVFAETRILAGLDKPEKWAALLGAGDLRRLRDRVELGFTPQNRTVLGSAEKVVFKLRIKHVERLILRVHEINARNFYRQNLREVARNEKLDGIVPGIEKIIKIGGSPYLRHEREITLPELARPGVYVVELIGGALKARAIVRKGVLHALAQNTAHGQLFTVFDGARREVKDATIWFDGREFTAAEGGGILVPFSSSPGRRRLVVSAGGVSSLGSFDHQGERFRLDCGFHLQRESLVIGAQARVIIRPQLMSNGQPASLSRIAADEGNAPILRIRLTNADGSISTQTLRKINLREDAETVLEFPVRNEIVRVGFYLLCKVKSAITNKHVGLSDSAWFATSSGRRGRHVAFLHLDRDEKGYHLRLLGRNGEPRPGAWISLSLQDRFFRDSIHKSLATDESGAVHLGELEGIKSLMASTPIAPSLSVNLAGDNASIPGRLELRAGEKTALAWPLDYVSRGAPRLLELRGGNSWRDLSAKLTLHRSHIELPALEGGAYRLLPAPGRTPVSITVLGGGKLERILVSESLAVEIPRRKPLFITSLKREKDQLVIQLNRGGEFVRVHILAERLMPGYNALSRLAVLPAPFGQRLAVRNPRSAYLSGVPIDGEYRYILERRFARKFPGNMLARPSLLLCPWDISESRSRPAPGAAGGRGFGGRGGRKRATRRYGGSQGISSGESGSQQVAPLDFLAGVPTLLANLDAGKKGLLRVPLKALAGLNCVEVVAVDPENLVRRRIFLASEKIARRDLRMRKRADYALHFARRNAVRALGDGEKLALAGRGQVAVYDSLENVWTLYAALLPHDRDRTHLAEFSFLLRWPKLKTDRRAKLYSKYACHELNFWLYNKDRKFFKDVIRPHLINKVDKTFMDQWLLGTDLSEYLRPDRFARLNAAERALLVARVKDSPQALRAERETVSIIPLNYDRLDRLFDRALGALALTAGKGGGARRNFPGPALGLGSSAPPPAIMAPSSPRAAERAKAIRKLEEKRRKSMKKGEYFKRKSKPGNQRALFRQVETTRVWAESNWYRLRRGAESPGRVPASRFWMELAAHDGKKPFVSGHIAETATNFSEAMLAMAALGLPLKGKPAGKNAVGPAIAYRRTESETKAPKDGAALTVVQRYFDPADRYEVVEGQRIEKYVSGPVLFRKVYGCVVTAMNASPRTLRSETLLELPAGAIPVGGSKYTQTPTQVLRAYSTARWEYYFYFPEAGKYKHYGAHLSNRKGLLAFAVPGTLEVKSSLPPKPGSPWMLVSQDGTGKEVLDYMSRNNVRGLDLNLIAFRMKQQAFFLKALKLLRSRRVYVQTLWSYALKHNDLVALREFLPRTRLMRSCGPAFRSRLLEVDPIEQISWEHLEFDPLINSRAHPINGKRHVTSDKQKRQFLSTLDYLSHRAKLSANERLLVVYHLLLQDRVAEGLEQFARVSKRAARGRMQYDFFDAYTSFYREDAKRAAKIAARYKDYAVPRWRDRFRQVLAQADEISGKAGGMTDEKNRLQQQTALARTEPSFDFSVEAGRVNINHTALKGCTVNFYLVDLELLFSRKPFSYLDTSRLAAVRPTAQEQVKFKAPDGKSTIAIPKKLSGKNLMIEVVAAGKRRAKPVFSRAIRVAVSENYGQLRVLRTADGKPLPKVYVKVYARAKRGSGVRFVKDGYTDLRGRFEYATVSGLNTNDFAKIAILVVAGDGSALVTEAKPPRD
jgi:hypothetical protein